MATPATVHYRLERTLALLLIAVFLTAAAQDTDPPLPIKSGTYTFHHRNAQLSKASTDPIKVVIRGKHITVAYRGANQCFSEDLNYDATLMWHRKSHQWIIGVGEADRNSDDVGGCNGGPTLVDFKTRTLWNCDCGP
jgi:hypothetical protein